LRDRRDDILALADYFLHQHAPDAKFSEEAMHALLSYPWPGNVRELKNIVFKAAIGLKAGAKEVRASDLPAAICGAYEPAPNAILEGNLESMERQMILQALARNGGNQIKAAQQLGISGRTLRRKLIKYRREEQLSGQNSLGAIDALQQRYFRVAVEIPVEMELEGEKLDAKSVNISSGGLAVQAPRALSHGSTMNISFTLPGSDSPIEATAKLAWSGPGGLAGLSIVEIHPALERELQGWLMEKARAEGWMESQAVR
jgi:hypothetical protein